jgi:hypothetical protein
MNLWRTTRTEVAGAWRSLRYDMSRREPGPEPEVIAQPDVTSTGMSTFGGPVDELRTGYQEFGRPPRRMVAVSVFALLTLAGAAGSYFAVVNGLGALLREKPPAPQAYPMAAAAPPADARAGATAGIGHGARPATARVAGVPPKTTATAGATSPAAVPTAAAVPAAPRRTTPERGTRPARTPCACVTPPVPTPTAPSTSPSATPSPSVTPSQSGDPSVSPSPSATDGSGEPNHRKRRPRGY